jgi:O-acetyl-ADP-ribose deacetylase (regulator of RNase III)
MITYYNGTVFNCGTHAIVNTVNCLGVMGAGIALEFSLRYPDMFKDYQHKCKLRMINTGSVDYYVSKEQTIINFPTKWHFKYPSKIEWIEQGLQHFVATYKNHNIKSVAFPLLGTNNGGLDREKIKKLMEKYLDPIDIPVYICLDVNDAEGEEKKMLEVINSVDLDVLKEQMRITEKQRIAIEENRPFRRFWMIKEVEGIGITFYSRIFNYCKEATDKPKPVTQLSLFDFG